MARPRTYLSEEDRRAAQNAASRRYRAAHPERVRADSARQNIKHTARVREARALSGGLSSAAEIVGACELCGVVGPRYWDHDHVTGQFRGWLCFLCNRALGGFRDDPMLLAAAAEYVSRRLLKVA